MTNTLCVSIFFLLSSRDRTHTTKESGGQRSAESASPGGEADVQETDRILDMFLSAGYLRVCVCVLWRLSRSQPALVHTCCGRENIVRILHG